MLSLIETLTERFYTISVIRMPGPVPGQSAGVCDLKDGQRGSER